MVGVELPLVPMEHHYLITEDLAELANAAKELPVVVDLDGEMYMRQERRGVLLGVYETPATPWAVGGTSWDYGETDLLAPDLARLTVKELRAMATAMKIKGRSKVRRKAQLVALIQSASR